MKVSWSLGEVMSMEWFFGFYYFLFCVCVCVFGIILIVIIVFEILIEKFIIILVGGVKWWGFKVNGVIGKWWEMLEKRKLEIEVISFGYKFSLSFCCGLNYIFGKMKLVSSWFKKWVIVYCRFSGFSFSLIKVIVW